MGVLNLVIWYSLISLDVNLLCSVGDLRRVVRSTSFADTVACCNGIEAALVCHKLVLELTTQRVKVNAYFDSRSVVENVYSTKI